MAFISDQWMPEKHVERRLLILAYSIVFLNAVILTFSPVIRTHSWQTALRWQHWVGVAIWCIGYYLVVRQARHLLPDRNPYLIPVTAVLSGWGLLTLYRLENYYGFRQSLWLLLGLGVLWLGIKFPDLLKFLQRYKYIWLVVGLALTALTSIFGTYPGGVGPRQWLGCCGIFVQPTEFLKLLLVVYLAAYFSRSRQGNLTFIQLMTPTLLLAGAALVLLVVQRDIGTAFLFVFIYTFLAYLASGRKAILVISAILILVAGAVAYYTMQVAQDRLSIWLFPWDDPEGRGYQIVQSLQAVAAGGLMGSGIGLGSPRVVPVAQSDFIFTAIAEESGLIGVSVLVILLGILFSTGIRIALKASSVYQRLLASGVTILLIGQSILIIGGNIRLLPLTGVTFPLLSYGGSSLIVTIIAVLLLLLISNSIQEPVRLDTDRRYQIVSTIFLGGLAAILAVSFWWGFIRREDLLARSDNPRRYIADVYVKRGSILDRNNILIAQSLGQSGSYVRQLQYVPMSNTIGYAHPRYGLTGLEDSMQPYLRGLQGVPTSKVFLQELLYSQPPPGLDLRLAVHLDLQQKADDLLGERKGSVVMINASTGEIYVIASHPYYDANQIDTYFNQWMNDPDSPLINRAVQGQYPIGSSIGPFVLADYLSQSSSLPDAPNVLDAYRYGLVYPCAIPAKATEGWGIFIAQGCPGASLSLAKRSGLGNILQIYRDLGFLDQPSLPLPLSPDRPFYGFRDNRLAFIGQEDVLVSPLQMALAAAALSSGGIRPAPRLTLAVQTPHQGWIVLPSKENNAALRVSGVSRATALLAVPKTPLWRATALAYHENQVVTWAIGGTQSSWDGIPLAIAVLLEENDPLWATHIAEELLLTTLTP